MEHSFQINLKGIINLLSDHLYSGPQVYIRELLQNSVDAICARQRIAPELDGRIEIELIRKPDEAPILVIEDNGIGLTEAEIHQFLSVIGQSSKTSDLLDQRMAFIGQFGIGLLSCFMVSDEITVLTKSAQSNAETLQWRGFPDGKYFIEKAGHRATAGTTVILRCNQKEDELFSESTVVETARKYGGMLPFPIFVGTAESKQRINDLKPPWHAVSSDQSRDDYLEFGEKLLGERHYDAIPLASTDGGIAGAAYVLFDARHHTARTQHRIYLKNMLLSESAQNILPEWAFFVKCIINADDLRPTASREDFYEDKALIKARENLGRCIIDYLTGLAESDPKKLQDIIKLHYLAMKALALEDDEFYRIIIDFLPFETTFGRITLGEYKKHNTELKYVSGLDQYRQVAQVAAAQSMWLINGGYVYDTELLAKHVQLFPLISVEAIDGASLTHDLSDISPEENNEKIKAFLKTAEQALDKFSCTATIKKFLPQELSVLYVVDEQYSFMRSVAHSKSISDAMWSGVLDNMTLQMEPDDAQVCFNFNNPLIQKLMTIKDAQLLTMSIRMLYVQALLLGHHPLNTEEMKILNTGFADIITWGIQKERQVSEWMTYSPKSLN